MIRGPLDLIYWFKDRDVLPLSKGALGWYVIGDRVGVYEVN